MLSVTQLCGFGAGGAAAPGPPPAELAFIALTHDNTDTATPSFAGASVGATDGTRRVIVVYHWAVTNAALTVNSATIGGVAATIHAQATNGPTSVQQNTGCAIFSALVPTGTTATVAVTLSGVALRHSIAVYRSINEVSGTPHAAMTDNVLSGNVLSGTLNVPATGMLVAGASSSELAGFTQAWAGVTENYDLAHPEAGGFAETGGHASGLASEVGRTVTMTVTGTITRGALAAVSWG